MKKLIFLYLSLFTCRISFAQNTKTIDLKTEYLTNPIGIDAANPRFAWRMESTERNVGKYLLEWR